MPCAHLHEDPLRINSGEVTRAEPEGAHDGAFAGVAAALEAGKLLRSRLIGCLRIKHLIVV
jgi:hypothetical protein